MPMLLSRQTIFFLLALALLSTFALAQRALVLSTGRNAARAPMGVHAQVVDMASASILPGTQSLPGKKIIQTLESVSRAGAIYLSTGSSPSENYMVGLNACPLERVAVTHFPGEANWSHKAVGMVEDEIGREHAVAIKTMSGTSTSKLSFYAWGEHEAVETWHWSVLGEITDAFVLEDRQLVVAAYRNSGRLPGGVMMGKLGDAPALNISLPVPEEGAGAFQPLKIAQYGNALLVLGLATQKDAPDKEALWAQLLELETLIPRGRAVQLSGTQMGSAEPLLYDGANGFWISSRNTDTRFAYVSRLAVTAAGLEKTTFYSLPKTSTPVYMAQAPGSPALALTYNETLEIWPDAKRENLLRREFAEPLGTITWLNGTQLLLGEAGVLHLVDIANIADSKTVQLQSGWIEKIIPLSGEFPPNAISDQDQDGIVDALDPEPLSPSPALDLPYKITFRGDAVGHEVRAIPFSPKYYEEASWRVEMVDAKNAQWLRMAPQKGFGQGTVYMGVDPERYDRGTWTETWLKIHMDGVTVHEAYRSPQWLLVQVQPETEALRRILWLWDTTAAKATGLRDKSDPRGVRTLADFLAAPLYLFSQEEATGVVDAQLGKYTILVVSLRALAQGQLVRSELLDYVVGGGAALILGDLPIDPIPKTLHEWFRPAGVEMLLSSPLSENVPLISFDGIEGDGIDLPVKQGVRFISKSGMLAPLDTEKGEAALVAKNYGYGRLLFLSDANALQSANLQDERHLRFALSCFNWLAGAGAAFGDMDGDLLVDGIEDANNNGIVDAGETDFLKADSDGDYLPDGAEDLNRNGKVDAGETDPRNSDTDGDGIGDAADPSPYPETQVALEAGGGA